MNPVIAAPGAVSRNFPEAEASNFFPNSLRFLPSGRFTRDMKSIPLALFGATTLVAVASANAETPPSSSSFSDLVVQDYTLNEDKPAGVAGEPEWVHQRRFSTTRVYIQKDPWEMGLEQWYRVRTYDGGRVTQRSQTEFELGLPYRMQLDIYEKAIHDNEDDRGWQQDEFAVELRYALADWGVIPLNPTLYFEYAFAHEGSDVIESKILFGDDFGKGWHWGLNLIHETQAWGERTDEFAVAGGISKTIVDNVFSVGIEGKWSNTTDEKSEAILGPSIQWRPTDNTHLDLVAMAGLNDSSPNSECWLIFGFDFGKGSKGTQGYKPTTVAGH